MVKSTILTKGSTINLLPDTEIKCVVTTYVENEEFTFKVYGRKYLYEVKYFITYGTHIKYQDVEYKIEDEYRLKLVDFTGKISKNNRADIDLMIGYVDLNSVNSDNNLVLLKNKEGNKIVFKKTNKKFYVDVDVSLLRSYIEKQNDEKMEISKNWYALKNSCANKFQIEFSNLILLDVSRLFLYKNVRGKWINTFYLTITDISSAVMLNDTEASDIRKFNLKDLSSSVSSENEGEGFSENERYKENDKIVECDHFEHSRTEQKVVSETDFKVENEKEMKDVDKTDGIYEKKDENTTEPEEKNQKDKDKETDEKRYKRNIWWLKIFLIVIGVSICLGIVTLVVYKWYLKKLAEGNRRRIVQ